MMESVELKISGYDWLYIVVVGAFFGFFISLFIYFLNSELQDISTIIFSITTSVSVAICASLLITISNNMILPSVNKRFWYLISFLFSFFSGAFGFLISFTIFIGTHSKIIDFISPYWFYITITTGFLTFLVGLILHQFISMKYKNESYKNELLSSQIKALENELNPHFLFNALNSMSELVYIDQQKAEQSILNLSKFLRNAIKRDSIIDIKDELEMVRTYVDIENIRFDNKIRLHIVKKTDDIKLPKFSIQLLVENAIKHGMENNTLNISIDIDKDIYVSNDGKLVKNLKYGTGLTNLDNRLKLLNIGKLEFVKDEKMKFKIEVNR